MRITPVLAYGVYISRSTEAGLWSFVSLRLALLLPVWSVAQGTSQPVCHQSKMLPFSAVQRVRSGVDAEQVQITTAAVSSPWARAGCTFSLLLWPCLSKSASHDPVATERSGFFLANAAQERDVIRQESVLEVS